MILTRRSREITENLLLEKKIEGRSATDNVFILRQISEEEKNIVMKPNSYSLTALRHLTEWTGINYSKSLIAEECQSILLMS
jgi:hypothetical protein